MDYASEEAIQRELGPAEHVLWVGRPRQGLVLRVGDAFLIPFSILWGGFAILWEAMVIAEGIGWFAALWDLPFVAVGLYLIIGRYWVDIAQRARPHYAVTSERVVIIFGLFGRRIKSLSIDTLSDVSLTERTNKSGFIMPHATRNEMFPCLWVSATLRLAVRMAAEVLASTQGGGAWLGCGLS